MTRCASRQGKNFLIRDMERTPKKPTCLPVSEEKGKATCKVNDSQVFRVCAILPDSHPSLQSNPRLLATPSPPPKKKVVRSIAAPLPTRNAKRITVAYRVSTISEIYYFSLPPGHDYDGLWHQRMWKFTRLKHRNERRSRKAGPSYLKLS